MQITVGTAKQSTQNQSKDDSLLKMIILSWVLLKVSQLTGSNFFFQELSMVKELRIKTYFLTLSCADLR